jgi:1-deoxy-D-xylulose-5-phosphate reductoisomerase
LKLAYQAGNSGGTAPCIFNAANEEAVSLFLSNKISFLEIPEKIDRTLQSISIQNPEELDGYLEADLLARETVRKNH